MAWTNHDAIHRHACHAHADFRQLRVLFREAEAGDTFQEREAGELWHSLSHHLRHVVYRSGHEVSDDRRRVKDVRRSHVASQHK